MGKASMSVIYENILDIAKVAQYAFFSLDKNARRKEIDTLRNVDINPSIPGIFINRNSDCRGSLGAPRLVYSYPTVFPTYRNVMWIVFLNRINAFYFDGRDTGKHYQMAVGKTNYTRKLSGLRIDIYVLKSLSALQFTNVSIRAALFRNGNVIATLHPIN